MTFNKMDKDNNKQNVLEKGDFDVEIDTGPSFSVQRDIALEFLQQTLQAFPQAFPLVADLWAKNLDVQFMPQISERFQTLVPPEILAKEKGEPPPPPKPNPEMMMQQQQMQMAQQKMQMEQKDLEIKQAKLQIEMSQVQERSEELQIRKEKHMLEQAEMMMKARDMEIKLALDHQKSQIEVSKIEHEFSIKIAELMAELHQSQEQREHEKQLNSNKIS
jgi:hypothetical protein